MHKIYIAHHDGNYQADTDTLKKLEAEGRIVFRYCDEAGGVHSASNPNGSMNNIAGIINDKGNVLGMMPHPERNADEALSSSLGGAFLFESIERLCR